MQAPKIIFQDKDILVINKPSGLVVNRAESVRDRTLQDWIEFNTQIPKYLNKQINKYQDFYKRSGVVHRLDKDTSGVMVIAKNPASFKNLQNQFKQRIVKKNYIALVHGKVEPRVGNIRMPLARKIKDRKKFTVRLGGKKSETNYKVKEYYKKDDQNYALLELQPKTGRTHQLRVHLKHIGHPIVGDPIYLGKKRLKEDREWCSRLFLHAKVLSFKHPMLKKKLKYRVEIPNNLQNLLFMLNNKYNYDKN